MPNYILSCTSTADLSKSHFEDRDIHYICLHFNLNGVDYLDDLGESIPFPEFYKRMAAGEMTKTSQPSSGDYIAYFTPFLESGKDIVHVCLSSGLSGDTNSANLAAQTLKEQFPNRKIYIVDSLGASSGYGLLMDKLADLRDEGLNALDLADWANEHKLEMNHFFFSTDLKYYVRGGRISRTSGFVGNLLHICPLLDMNNEGKLIPLEKVHGTKKVINRIVEKMVETADKGLSYDGKVYISMSNCPELANPVKELVEKTFPKMNGKVLINSIGTTIGSHTGPGTVALFFWGKKRGDR